jgi:SAM-dependent methyltransferase
MAENDRNRAINYDMLVDGIIGRNGAIPNENTYLGYLRDSYVRTLRDIDSLFGLSRSGRILEIGSLLGVVSVSLKRMGYDLCALDIPELSQNTDLMAFYENSGIPFTGVNLRKYALPYESLSFDAVVICEVMEHLNFNPLPVLMEVNRILKKGGFLYIAGPNQASIYRRIRLLLGQSVHNTIDDFFDHIDKDKRNPVGLHWREYTLNETVEMVQRMGFKTADSRFFGWELRTLVRRRSLSTRSLVRFPALFMVSLLCLAVPSFRHSQVVIAEKISETRHQFWFTEANT